VEARGDERPGDGTSAGPAGQRARLADRRWDQPHPDRLDPGVPRWADILAAHAGAVNAGQPGYLDPETGLFVLTSAFLADRGTCCGRGCRHCPYVV